MAGNRLSEQEQSRGKWYVLGRRLFYSGEYGLGHV
jgi:hypothetical protein